MPRKASKNTKAEIKAKTCALLLIDVITDFEFEDGDELLRRMLPAARILAEFKALELRRMASPLFMSTITSENGRKISRLWPTISGGLIAKGMR